VFVGEYSPESYVSFLFPQSHITCSLVVAILLPRRKSLTIRCGDYASGTNHTLPTNGFARQFSGVNTLSFQKHITSQQLTADGLRNLGPTVVTLAEREGLEGHANAVRVRLAALKA
jgi:phosphoribosyl-ATP pyrophosphohydrolase/phosphoribosyl-AMP cyclohydrolase/histidinol dehydrogenase